MRVLEIVDFAQLLSFFALLLLAFGFDFNISKSDLIRGRKRVSFFIYVSIVGEVCAAVGVLLTWVSIFFVEPTIVTDAKMVFIPGSIAVVCIIILTIETSWSRLRDIREQQ